MDFLKIDRRIFHRIGIARNSGTGVGEAQETLINKVFTRDMPRKPTNLTIGG